MKRRSFLNLFSLATLSSMAGFPSLARAEDRSTWLGWRGPMRDGYGAKNSWPSKLDEAHLKLEWEKELDSGYSGPIVTSDLVIVTETRKKKEEFVIAFDRSTGEKRWEASWEGAMSVPFFAKSNGDWIRSTPACDGKSIFVAGMRDVLVSLDVASGKENWRVDFVERFKSPLPDFGFVCSPLLHGEHVFVQAGSGFVKLKKDTGEVVWRVLVDEGGMNGSAFSSPTFATLRGQEMILVQTRSELVGLRENDGGVLFRKKIDAFRGMNILTPTVWRDSLFTSSYGGKSWLFDLASKSDGPWDVSTRWEARVQGYMSSPIIIGEHLYLHLQNQRFTCFDLNTGKQTFTTKPYGKYWSMVTNGEQMLALDERGVLLLIQANPTEFQLLDERKITENESWAHLAVVDQQVFVRHLKGIQVFRWH